MRIVMSCAFYETDVFEALFIKVDASRKDLSIGNMNIADIVHWRRRSINSLCHVTNISVM